MGQARIAITGIGMICALGTQREAVWEHMLAGQCGIGPVTLFDTEGYRSRIAAEVDLPRCRRASRPTSGGGGRAAT